MFLAAAPTGVDQTAAAVIQLALSASARPAWSIGGIVAPKQTEQRE